jgi:hypothetical protein
MGFNKRYINEEKIKTIIKNEGLLYLIDFIKKPDALIVEDEFSEKVCNIIKENEKMAFVRLLGMGVYGK